MSKACLVVTLVAALAFRAAAGEAKLVCEAPTFDFGTITSAQITNHTFVMRNAGNATATISRVHSTCGCTTTQPTRKEVSPGESESLVVQFNPKSKMGVQNRRVYVRYNSTNDFPLTLSITGTVVAAILTDPAAARFGVVPTTGAVERVVRIHSSLSNCVFHITGVTIPHVAFSNRIDTVVDGHDYRLVVMSGGPRKAGLTVAVSATVTTDNPAHVAIAVPIFLRVTGGASADGVSGDDTSADGTEPADAARPRRPFFFGGFGKKR